MSRFNFPILIFVFSSAVFANDTSINTGAYGPEMIDVAKNGESDIRLESERLHFRFGMKTCSVDVEFVFINTRDKDDIEQEIGFPDLRLAQEKQIELHGSEQLFPYGGGTGHLENLKTRVNNKIVETKVKYGKVRVDDRGHWLPGAGDNRDYDMAWHTVKVHFPAGKRVRVRRTYTTENGVAPYWYRTCLYVTDTGSSWKGKIGSLVAEVDLDDGIKAKHLTWIKTVRSHKLFGDTFHDDHAPIVMPSKSDWKLVSDNKLKLIWTNFEPAKNEDKSYLRLTYLERDLAADVDWIVGRILEESQLSLAKLGRVCPHLNDHNPESLRLIRNAIFAKHNYKFKDTELVSYYSARSKTYQPLTRKLNLSERDKTNVELVKSAESGNHDPRKNCF